MPASALRQSNRLRLLEYGSNFCLFAFIIFVLLRVLRGWSHQTKPRRHTKTHKESGQKARRDSVSLLQCSRRIDPCSALVR